MNILGINAFNSDSAAALLADGRLVGAVEEERFRRIKHWAGFPTESIRYLLDRAGLKPGEIDHVAIGRKPTAHLPRKILFALRRQPALAEIRNRLSNMARVTSLRRIMANRLDVDSAAITARFHAVEHHRAHMASSYFLSPFDTAACLTVDGSGDFVTTMFGAGQGRELTIDGWVEFPHSLGLFYTAVTQYLGFEDFGEEYKVMGLAPYGEPEFLDAFRGIVSTREGGQFRLDLDWFRHHKEGIRTQWEGDAPSFGRVYSDAWVRRFGPARTKDAPLEDRHRNLARSLQAVTEEIYFHALAHVFDTWRDPRLCLAGGCAFNSVANGKILEQTDFSDLHIHPAAGDAGTAVGAALCVWHEHLGRPREYTLDDPFLGPDFSDERIQKALDATGQAYEWIENAESLTSRTAERLAAGDVIGWFQGRSEWGPRALGNRSILADPRRPDMKEILNARIKRRESFRPFAPSILEERCAEYFEQSYPVPFMSQVYVVREDKRQEIPAVTHVDGTGRLQTVGRAANPLFHRLIEVFAEKTGTPVLLNTSFNENEPIVNDPEQAIDCFLRTRMDSLVLGNAFVEK